MTMTENNMQTDQYAYDGVLFRRMFAFLTDYILIALLCVPVAIGVFFLGILTLGVGFLLFPILGFLTAMAYFGQSLSSASQATPGMRAFGLTMVLQDHRPIDFPTAVVHVVLFWILNSVLTPLVLLVGLFTDKNRLLHDIMLGTEVRRSPW